jgi:hypothetical protein
MCNANPHQQTILNSINTYTTDYLVNFLTLHNFELSCMLKYGISPEKLNELDIELIRERVEKENISKEQMLEAGLTRTKIDKIFSIGGGGPVSSVSCPICEMTFESQENYMSYKQTCFTCFIPPPPPESNLIKQIKEGKANVLDIQDGLLEGTITTDELKIHCGLDDKLIQRIYSYSSEQMDTVDDINALPPLKKDRTDFYFFGMPSAGKSCLIASLLSHWMREGICNPEVSNPRGVKYFRILGGGFSKGILPRNNPNTFLDYIELTLSVTEEVGFFKKRKRKYDIPINILDMAGEKFKRVVETGPDSFDKHKNYLNNGNPKALFFVLDYSVDDGGVEAFEQSLNLVVLLNILKEMGILDESESIYLMVTKADMFDVPLSQYNDKAKEYVNTYYAQFKNRLEDLSDQFGFSWEVMPYSIGQCAFGQLLLDYNPNSNPHLKVFPEQVSDKIKEHTARYKRGIGGVFTN